MLVGMKHHAAIKHLDATRLSRAESFAIWALLSEPWPRPEQTPEEAAQTLRQQWKDYDGPANRAPRYLVVLGDGAKDGQALLTHSVAVDWHEIGSAGPLVANAMVQPRKTASASGEMTVLALARVCTHPERRGCGLGAAVVREAFSFVDQGTFPFALFQTTPPVRPFYEKLGACSVDNRIIDSSADDPEANPFTHGVTMRYPDGPGWPEGTIDILGPGY